MAEKPSNQLKLICWKGNELGSESFLIKFLGAEDKYELLIYDRKEGNLWYECLNAEKISNRNTEMNPALEMPMSKLICHVEDVLDPAKSSDMRCSQGSSEGQLKLIASRPLAGLTFSWKFMLSPLGCTEVSEQLTEPLMLLMTELLRRQRSLCAQLKSKDRELEDYKAQAVQLTRKKLETKPFNEETFHEERDASPGRCELLNLDTSSLFDTRTQNIYSNISEFVLNKQHSDQAAGSLITDPSLSSRTKASDQSTQATDLKPINHSPVKRPVVESTDMELQRRQELERKLAEKDGKEAKKKKKKLNL